MLRNVGVKASELSLTPTKTPQTTLSSSTQLFTLTSAPHTQLMLMFQRFDLSWAQRESRGSKTTRERLPYCQNNPLQSTVATSALCLSPRLSHSPTEDLLSFPLDFCLFCQHPSLLIHTIYSNWCSSYNESNRWISFSSHLHSYINVLTSTSIIILLPLLWSTGIWVQQSQIIFQWQHNNNVREQNKGNGFLQKVAERGSIKWRGEVDLTVTVIVNYSKPC